ncbi:uncharacterized protein LOC131605903 [Vicia villosa]|uniref:uncharacterized protein LOC131605903 n=1 Tax=Vicia villosa TaxID=3911 RepID=UPI00273C4486|nr:uncharacterized protein LOC131605903 [Vicia villosa]
MQINEEQSRILTRHITEQEVYEAMKRINYLTAPGVDGFGMKFFKAAWPVVRKDIMDAVQYFFNKERLYKAVNNIIVTLIAKFTDACMIMDFGPISCCTNVYKMISKIMDRILSKVLCSIIHMSQAAFVPGQHLHDHVMLAYELIRGYSTKGEAPRCMLLVDL